MPGLLALAALLAAISQGPTAVVFHIDDSANRAAISPLIYGTNAPDWNGAAKGLDFTRLGGNRWTAFNWENNASNAGSDYQFQNDSLLGGDAVAGASVVKPVAAALAAGATVVVTIPIAGYVSADKNGGGDIRKNSDYLTSRLVRSLPKKGAPFVYPPDTSDHAVYQDEFVAYLEQKFPRTHPDAVGNIYYSLDNEPGLWDSTHAELRTKKLTYAEIMKRSIDFASGIKAVAPKAFVFGPVSYGWAEFDNLQGATDANGRNFLEFYLAGMRDAGQAAGKRLLDVLDVHWYPEARGGGKRVVESGSDPALVKARLQAPRSLWDPGYTEESWITQYSTKGPIRLLPRLKEKIANNYPGTRLSMTEYNYGGGADISGGIAQADVLGIFGREGVFAAAEWPMASNEAFIYGGFAMFRNFDGKLGAFGNTSIMAQTSDIERTSAYASVDSANPGRLVIVAINKSNTPITASLVITSKQAYGSMDIYVLDSSSAAPHANGHQALTASPRITLPAMSVSTLVLHK